MSRFQKNISTMLSINVIAQAISIGFTPVITRLYTPDHYGMVGIFIAVCTFPIMLSTARYHIGIISSESKERELALIHLCFLLTILTTVISLFIFSISPTSFFPQQHIAETEILLLCVGTYIFARSSNIIFQFATTKSGQFREIGRSQLADPIAYSSLATVLGLTLGSNPLFLVCSRILGAFATLSTYLLSIRWYREIANRNLNYFEIEKQAKENIRYPIYSLPASIVNTAAFQLPVIIIGVLFDPAMVGFYVLAERIIVTPLSLIGNAISSPILHSAKTLINKREELHNQLTGFLSSLFNILIFPFVLAICLSQDLFSYIFGSNWQEAGKVAAPLFIMGLFRVLAAPLTNILNILNQQDKELYFNLALASSRVGSIYIGFLLDNFYLGIYLLGISSAICYLYLLTSIFSAIKSDKLRFQLPTIRVLMYGISALALLATNQYLPIAAVLISLLAASLAVYDNRGFIKPFITGR